MLHKLFGPVFRYQKLAVVKDVWLEHLNDPKLHTCIVVWNRFGYNSCCWWVKELDTYLIEKDLKRYAGRSIAPFSYLTIALGGTEQHHRRQFLEYMKNKYNA